MVWGQENYRQADGSGTYAGLPGGPPRHFRVTVLKSCCLLTLACENISHRFPGIDRVPAEPDLAS